jgi:hypothetical protein
MSMIIRVEERITGGMPWPQDAFSRADEATGVPITVFLDGGITTAGFLLGVEFSEDRTVAQLTVEITDQRTINLLRPRMSDFSIGDHP